MEFIILIAIALLVAICIIRNSIKTAIFIAIIYFTYIYFIQSYLSNGICLVA